MFLWYSNVSRTRGGCYSPYISISIYIGSFLFVFLFFLFIKTRETGYARDHTCINWKPRKTRYDTDYTCINWKMKKAVTQIIPVLTGK